METIGCSGMTHSAAMAAEILPGRTVLEALNTDLVCDAINTAMRELFLTDRLRKNPERISPRKDFRLEPALRILERDFAPRSEPCTAP